MDDDDLDALMAEQGIDPYAYQEEHKPPPLFDQGDDFPMTMGQIAWGAVGAMILGALLLFNWR